MNRTHEYNHSGINTGSIAAIIIVSALGFAGVCFIGYLYFESPTKTTNDIKGADKNSKLVKTSKLVIELEQAINHFVTCHNQYPAGLQDLYQCPPNIANIHIWKPYIKKSNLIDAWGHELKYDLTPQSNGKNFKVWSLGPKINDHSDDIGNWDIKTP